MPNKARRKPVRAPTDNIGVALTPEAGARARAAAAHYGMTLTEYFEALVLGQELVPMPASLVRLGGCIIDAIAVLSSDRSEEAMRATQLLREAQRLGAEYESTYLPAFNALHPADDIEQSTDLPRVR